MAMRPKTVILDGNEISEVVKVRFKVNTPVERNGQYGGTTVATDIILTREADHEAIPHLFKLATNRNGQKHIFEGRIELQDDHEKVTYSFSLKKAFIYRWKLHNPRELKSPVYEEIGIRCGDLETSAGGGSASFALKTFD